MLSSLEITKIAVKALDSKQARDIQILKTDKVTVLADYFIICTATSDTHSKTLADETDKLLSEAGEPLCLAEAAPFLLTDFRRSGATSGWFVTGPDDKPVRKLMKKGLALLLRSRPKLGEGCTGCGHCARLCPAHAISIKNRRAVIDRRKCVRCFCCQEFCPAGAMRVQRTPAARLLSK